MPQLHVPYSNKYIIFDEEDSSLIASLNIFISGTFEHESVCCSEYPSRQPYTTLGRYLLKITDSKIECDHKDRNIYNFKRENLRLATRQQQLMNRDKYISNTSGFKGVMKHSTNKNRWRARLNKNGKTLYDECFGSPEEAARGYDKAAKIHFGEFAVLNFPEIIVENKIV